MLWLIAGGLVLPPVFGWLGAQGIVILPGMAAGALWSSYLYFVQHLREPLILAVLGCPYLMFIAARLLQEKPAPMEGSEPDPADTHGEAAAEQQPVYRGADPKPGSAAGETPLHIAALRGDMGMAWLLLEDGADFNATDHALGCTPLQIAALRGHADICEALIRYGAAVDVLTSRQETALHLAARAGHEGAIAVLLKYRANTGLRNSAGLTAQQLAEQHGHADIVTLMKEHASNEWAYLRLSNG